MTIHVLSLPHTQLTEKYVMCAYTQKVVKLCKMLVNEGVDVTVYASEDNETPAKLMTCITKSKQAEFGFGTPETYNQMVWDNTLPIWKEFHGNAITAFKSNLRKGDMIGTFAGTCDAPIRDAFPNHRFIELGIGYSGVFSDFRVFESWAWLHTVYGNAMGAYQANGRLYDTVIPNFFEKADFPYSEHQGNYVLYVGRMIWRKGLQIVSDLAERFPDTDFILAGLGGKQIGNKILCNDITIEGNNLHYIGPINAERRGSLMSRAQALICPTMYIGPFEGVHVEAMMCGTPVLTTPFGVFSESYRHGEHGFKCHTLNEFERGLTATAFLDRKKIRDYAQSRYSTEVVAKLYLDYFERLEGLDRGGFYEPFCNCEPELAGCCTLNKLYENGVLPIQKEDEK